MSYIHTDGVSRNAKTSFETIFEQPTEGETSENINCEDFFEFKSYLNEKRKVDNNFNFLLNRSDKSVRNQDKLDCSLIKNEFNRLINMRMNQILQCIQYKEQKLDELQNQYSTSTTPHLLNPEIKSIKTDINFLNDELDIEKTLQHSNEKLFKKKCQNFTTSSSPK